MIPAEISLVMAQLELSRRELADLLGISHKTLYRWAHNLGLPADHPALVLLHALAARIEQEPRALATLRAFAHISVANGGLPHFIDRCLTSHLNADQKG